MNNLDLIYAEAAVRSTRSDYKSIFDPKADLQSDDLKQFWADPIMTKQAIEKLKQAGFGINTVDKFTVGIMGTKELFEGAFGVTLIAEKSDDGGQAGDIVSYTVANHQPPDVIDTSKGDFNQLLAGVALAPYTAILHVTGGGPPAPSVVELHQIPGLLSGWKNDTELGQYTPHANEEIRVLVIDSGCDTRHAYYDGSRQQISVSIAPPLEETHRYLRSIWEKENEKERKIQRFADQFVPPAKTMNLVNIEYYLNEVDDNGHGTGVTAHLMTLLKPIANKSIAVSKVYVENDIVTKPWFPDLTNVHPKPHVINCSYGHSKNPRGYFRGPQIYRLYELRIKQAIRNNIIVVFASGNFDDARAREISIETQIPGVISVGAAYPVTSGDHTEYIASNVGHGFPKEYLFPLVIATPHVVGICGPRDKKILNTPAPVNEWKLVNGTSFAAPQISGICAVIKAICPIATPEQVKEILMRTSTPVEKGVTGQGKKLTEIMHQIGEDQLSPGLVNIKKALFVANYFQAFHCAGNNRTIKNAVEVADNLGI